MSALTSPLCSTLLFVGVFVFISADQKTIIKAESGQNVILPCLAPNSKNKIIVVEWSRTDLETENVFLYRDGQFASAKQHPSFKNRVDLQDRQMRNGDVSSILKDVMINDTGTYLCRIYMEGTQLWEHTIIYLRVVPPGQTGGHTEDGEKTEKAKEDGSAGLRVGVSVVGLFLVAEIVVLYWWLKKRKKQSDPAGQEMAKLLKSSEEKRK